MQLGSVSDKLIERVTWRNILRVQEAAGWTDSELAERLGLTLREFQKNRAAFRPVRIAPLIALAESLEVNPESFLFGKLDYVALEKHLNGDWAFIPQIYTDNAQSSRDIARNYLAYHRDIHGVLKTARLLRQFQITYNGIMNGNEPINFLLTSGVAKAVSSTCGGEDVGVAIGANAINYFKQSMFQRQLTECKNVQEVYVYAADLAGKYLEANLAWKVEKITSSSLLVSGTPTQESLNLSLSDSSLAKLTENIRLGYLYALPRLAGQDSLIEVTPLAAFSQGDSRLKFEIKWANLNTSN